MRQRQAPVVVLTRAGFQPGPATPGMVRLEAFTIPGAWSGFVRTESGMISGWHHHGAYDSIIYVVRGALRMEFGPDGADAVEAAPGDFVLVPKGTVHRESNPSAEPADIVVVRVGTGDSTVNVDGPPA